MNYAGFRQIKSIFIGILALGLVLAAGAQGTAAVPTPGANPAGADPRPSVSLAFEPAALVPGQPAVLVATLVIPPELHLVRQDGLFGLSIVNPPAGLTAAPPILPPPHGQIAGTDIYTGTLRIEVPLTVSPSLLSQAIQVSLSWQICYDTGICLRPVTEILPLQLTVASGSVGPDWLTLLGYLGLALLGGLLLNFMPCVLPVLSLKAMALVGEAGVGNPRRRKQQGLAMVAGIIVSMLALAALLLAFQAGGRQLGWGFQFQSPWYTLVLLVIVFGLGLSLFEVWNLPQIQLRRSAGPGREAGGTLAGNFGSGALTVLLATPCTAPFLGTALGFALAAPPLVLLLIFAGIGVGLSLPFGLVVLLPGKGLRLPKPGPWLGHFRELMGFALMATVVWLLSVLQQQVDQSRFVAAMAFLLTLAVVLRAWTWVGQSSHGSVLRRALLAGLAAVCLAAGWLFVAAPALEDPRPGTSDKTSATATDSLPAGWNLFDEAAVAADLAAGHGVFIDFTAAWCLSCKINEAGALADSGFLARYRAAGVTLYRGDYTNPDPVITSWLQRYQRAGVPFYLLLRPGKPALVLPELLTPGILASALD